MAILTRAQLKALFYDGAFVTAATWQNVIDSVMLIAEQRIPVVPVTNSKDQNMTFSKKEISLLVSGLSKLSSSEANKLIEKIKPSASVKSKTKTVKKKK